MALYQNNRSQVRHERFSIDYIGEFRSQEACQGISYNKLEVTYYFEVYIAYILYYMSYKSLEGRGFILLAQNLLQRGLGIHPLQD